MDMDQDPPQLDSVSTPQDLPFQIPNPDLSFPAVASQPDSATPPLLAPHFLSKPEPSSVQLAPQQLAETAAQSQLRNKASDLPLSLNLVGPLAAPDPSDAQAQQQTQIRSPGSAPHSPPGSSAVWKKNQGQPLLALKHTAVTCHMCVNAYFHVPW